MSVPEQRIYLVAAHVSDDQDLQGEPNAYGGPYGGGFHGAGRSWFPVCAGMGITTITICIWQALSAQEAVVASQLGINASNLADELVLVFGMALAVAFSLAVNFAQTAQMRARIAEKEIVDRKRAESILAQRAQELKELNELQRQFVAMASHEFRTPLSIIDGAAQRMMRRVGQLTPDDIQERSGKIRSAVKRMTMLIDSTLSVARLDAGQIALNLETMDLAGAIAATCTRQQEIGPRRKISVDFGRITAPILADPTLLDQVFTNILSNAVKYSPDDALIEVKGWIEGEQALVSVRDNGLGIPDNDLPGLFERFFRAGTSTGIAGTGIGLHLAMQLVEMHGGSIEVESVEGEGSTFTVRLPIKPAEDVIARTARRAS